MVGDDELVDGLLAAGVLRRNAVAERYLCGEERKGCWRDVFRCDLPGRPYVARCSLDPEDCLPTYLTEAQLEEYEMPHGVFVDKIRSGMCLRGTLQDIKGLDAIRLGDLHENREALDVFLCRGLRPAIRTLVAERASAPRRSMVFVPSDRLITPEILQGHGIGSRVVLGYLCDVLELQSNRLVVNGKFHELLRPAAPPASHYCWIQDQSGRRGATEPEARGMLDQADQYDLFVDATHELARGRYFASCKDHRGVTSAELLSRTQARALVELLDHPNGVEPGAMEAFRQAQVENPTVEMRRIRPLVDVRDASGRWRAIHSISGGGAGHRRYVFRPAPGMTYAFLIPYRATG